MKFAVLLLVASLAIAEDRVVEITLTDGTTMKAALVDFGSRTYRFRVGNEVVEISEDRIASIDFHPDAAAAKNPPPADGKGLVATVEGDLCEVLQALATKHGMSLILGPSVRGKVTAFIPDGDPRAALEAIAMGCNYVVQEANGVLSVVPGAMPLQRFTPPAENDGPPATLDAKEEDIGLVLPLLAKAAGRGLVISPSARGKVSLRFAGVPALVALDSAAAAVNCGLFEAKGGILIVYPAAPRTSREPRSGGMSLGSSRDSWEWSGASEQEIEASRTKGATQPEEWAQDKRGCLHAAEDDAKKALEAGTGTQADVVRAWFRATQFDQWLGLVSDEEFEKVRSEAQAKMKAICEAELKAGTLSPADLAKARLELLDLFRALPREGVDLVRPGDTFQVEVVGHPELGGTITVSRGGMASLPNGGLGKSWKATGMTVERLAKVVQDDFRRQNPTLDVRVSRAGAKPDAIGQMVTDNFYQRPENRFELRERWSTAMPKVYGCAATGGLVYATTEDGAMFRLDAAGKTLERFDHEPGILRFADLDGDGAEELISIQNFMFGRFSVWEAGKDRHWEKSRWTAQSTHGGLNVPQIADLDGDGRMEVFVAAYGGGGTQVFSADGKTLWDEDNDASGLCAIRREGEKGRALVACHFGHGVNVLGYGGRKEEDWKVESAKCVASGDLDGDGFDEVTCGEGTPGWIDGKDRIVARRGKDGSEIWSYDLPQGFALREANALAVEDLDGDGKAEILVSLSPGMMTREGDKVYHCFLCLIDAKGRPAWISKPFEKVGDVTMGSFCVGLSAADIDGDGKKEVILGVLQQGVHVYDVVR